MKTILMPFSGGLDSTYLLYKNLKEGNVVHPIYVLLPSGMNKAKHTIEEVQAKKIVKFFQKTFPDTLKNIRVVTGSAMSCYQIDYWSAGLNFVKDEIEFDEIHVGIISDDLIELSTEKEKNKAIEFKLGMYSKNNLEVEFPLINNTKKEISHLLPKTVLNMIFSCETPLYEYADKGALVHKCGNCNPCKLERLKNLSDIKSAVYKINKEVDVDDLNKDYEYSTSRGRQDLYNDILKEKGLPVNISNIFENF